MVDRVHCRAIAGVTAQHLRDGKPLVDGWVVGSDRGHPENERSFTSARMRQV
jgi:hypothetical protein